jgi:hypothetical protein
LGIKGEKSMTDKLKECPFCGADAVLWPFGIVGGRWKISGSNDCVTMPPRFETGFTTKDEALKKWNTRLLTNTLNSLKLCERFNSGEKYDGDQVRDIILNVDDTNP